jgi:hypothetical protein
MNTALPDLRTTLIIAAFTTIASLTAGCNAEEIADESATSEQALTGGCLPGVDACLRNGGGGGCIKQHCFGSCTTLAAQCARERPGNKSSCVDDYCGSPVCFPHWEYVEDFTSACGATFGPATVLPGKAQILCVRECSGKLTQCSLVRNAAGLPVCTLGVPRDASRNPK